MSLSNFAENKLADFARGASLVLPSNWAVGLCSAASDSTYTEVAVAGYARVLLGRSLTNWSGTQGAGTTLPSNGASHQISNNVAIDFGTTASAWGSVTHVVLFDNDLGDYWFYIPIAPRVIGSGDPVVIDAGALQLLLGISGGMSDYLANKLLDLLFRGEAYSWPATVYAALYTAPPSNAGGGTEVTAGGYGRVAITSNFATWSSTQSSGGGAGSTDPSSGTDGRIANNVVLTYPSPTGLWGTVTHEGLRDAATGGNLLFWQQLASPKTVLAGGTAPSHAEDTLGIRFG